MPASPSFRPRVESLEDRVVLSGSPLTAIPALHSNPGAAVSVYLDFNGHFEPGWWGVPDDGNPANDSTGQVADENGNIVTVTVRQNTDPQTGRPALIDSIQPIYDRDGDITTFNDQELADIRDIWLRVADDYAPFNVDVTTVRPPVIADRVAILAAVKFDYSDGGTSKFDAFTNSLPNSVYASGWNSIRAAGVVSQEVGHTFGLGHHHEFNEDGSFKQEYRSTLPGRALIMGDVSGTQRNTWWVSPSDGRQNDVTHIALPGNGFGFRADDIVQTSALQSQGTDRVGGGIIGQLTDTDSFRFDVTTSGRYRIRVDVVENLDATLELRDASGALIEKVDPSGTAAEIVRSLPAGQYTLTVGSHGAPGVGAQDDVGDLGMYTVRVSEAYLRVVASDPRPDRVRLTFNNPVDPASFAANLPRVLTQSGTRVGGVAVRPVAGTDNRVWDVTFTRTTGGYRLEVGPNVRDPRGVAMDQDRDGVPGEAIDDRYAIEDFTAPKAGIASVAGPVVLLLPSAVTWRQFRSDPAVLVRFSEPMDPASLVGSNIQIVGPGGPVTLSAPRLLSGGTEWTYAFSVPATPGTFKVTLNPGLTDLFGNRLAQKVVQTVQMGAILAGRPIEVSLEKLDLWLRGGRCPIDLPPRVEPYIRAEVIAFLTKFPPVEKWTLSAAPKDTPHLFDLSKDPFRGGVWVG